MKNLANPGFTSGKKIIHLILLLIATAPLQSCLTSKHTTDDGKLTDIRNQTHDFERIEKGIPYLKQGLAKIDVINFIGMPAYKNSASTIWTYLPNKPSYIIPVRALVVHFRYGRYSHHTRDLTFGR